MALVDANEVKIGIKEEDSTEYNPFKFPANVTIARQHGKAKMVYKKRELKKDKDGKEIPEDFSNINLCVCCGLPLEGEKIRLGANLKELYHLGTGFALYFKFIKYSIAILMLLMLVTGVYNLVSNVVAADCAAQSTDTDAYCFQGYILSFTIPNKKEDPDALFAQIAVNFVAVVLVMFFFQYLRYQFRRTEIEAENMNVTPSDYTIVVDGVPPASTEEEITQFFEGFGTINVPVKVVRVIKPHAITDYVELKNHVSGLQQQHEELKKKGDGRTQADEKKFRRLSSDIERVNRKLEALKTKQFQYTSVAYVTFETANHSDYIQKKFKKSLVSSVLRIFVSRIVDTRDKFQGRTIDVKRAPEPTDIMWQNLGANPIQRKVKNTVTNTTSAVLIIITLGLIILVNWGQDKAGEKYGKKSVIVQVLSFIGSIVIVTSNTMLAMTIDYLTRFEKHHTYTHFLQGVAQKLAVAQFVNTALSTLFAELILSDTAHHQNRLQAINFYGKGGLLESIYWVFITNAFLVPILTLLDLGYHFRVLRRWLMKKTNGTIALAQKDAQLLYEGSQMGLPAKYATIIKVMLMTCLYAPAMPFALIYASLGLVLTYWADKYTLLRRHALPKSIDDDLTDSMVEYLEWASCAFSVGNIMYVFTLKDAEGNIAFPLGTTPLVWLSLGVSLFHIMFPMELLNQKLFPIKDIVTETSTFEEARKHFTTVPDYDMTNPITKERALKQHLHRIREDKPKCLTFIQKLQGGNLAKLLPGLGGSFKLNESEQEEGFNFEALDEYCNHVQHQVGEKPTLATSAGLNFFSGVGNTSPKTADKLMARLFKGVDLDIKDNEPSPFQPNQEAATPERASLIQLPWLEAGGKIPTHSGQKDEPQDKEQLVDLGALNFVAPHFQKELLNESRHGTHSSGNVDTNECIEEREPTVREFVINRTIQNREMK